MTAQPYLRPDDCHCGSSMGQDHARGCPQAEPVDRRDTHCDRCLKTIYSGTLTPQTMSGTTEWLCDSCRARDAERYEAMVEQSYKDVYGPEYALLATYQEEGR